MNVEMRQRSPWGRSVRPGKLGVVGGGDREHAGFEIAGEIIEDHQTHQDRL
jgi:hypothetical protein